MWPKHHHGGGFDEGVGLLGGGWLQVSCFLSLFFATSTLISIFIDLGSHFVRLGALRARFLRVPGRSGEGFGPPKALFLHVFSHFGQEVAIL